MPESASRPGGRGGGIWSGGYLVGGMGRVVGGGVPGLDGVCLVRGGWCVWSGKGGWCVLARWGGVGGGWCAWFRGVCLVWGGWCILSGGWCVWSGGCVCLVRGCVCAWSWGGLPQCLVGYHPHPPWTRHTNPPPVNRMTNRCKNITLATTSLRPVINNTM